MTAGTPCPLCRRPSSSPLYVKNLFPIFRCPVCQILFVGAPPPEAQVIYGERYYQWIDQDPSAARQIKMHTFGPWLQSLRHLTPPGNLLDIGCALGFLLETAEAEGWTPYGIEISDHARAIASQRFGPHAIFRDLASLKPASLRFQVVTLCDVIEHLYDLDALLEGLRNRLAADGILFLTTPNTRSLLARGMGRFWFHVKPLEHPVLFSPQALSDLLRRHGFIIFERRRAIKWMNLEYVFAQFNAYQFPFHRWMKWIGRLCPRKPASWLFPVYTGEMIVMARLAKKPEPGSA